ncbi:hypothetical protein DFJ43DRAFT_996486, partial [Lentinula guzmanii]
MRDTYARSVLKHLRNSEGATSVFAWPKGARLVDANEVTGRDLQFGFVDDPTQHRFGDPLAERLEYILRQSAPFPGELVSNGDVLSSERFVAYRISDHAHLILDAVHEDLEIQIATSLLTNPDFEPGAWYARRLFNEGIAAAIGKSTSSQMGDVRARRVSQILNGASRYPGDNLPDFHPRRNK